MAKPLLPLKNILEGDYKSLTQSFRTVTQQDNATLDYRPEYSLDELIKLVAEAPLPQSSSSPELLTFFLSQHLPEWSIYKTDSPIALLFCDKLISKLYGSFKVHPDIEPSFHRINLLILLSLSKRQDAIADGDHPLRQFTERLYQMASVWEPAGGRTGKAFLNQLQHLEGKLPDFDIQSNQAWKQQTLALQAIHNATETRTEILEQRLKESFISNPEAEKRQQLVSRWINKKLNNIILPSQLLLFIRLELIPDLQYLVVQKGEQHPTWSKWQKLLHLFSWIFKEADETEAKQNLMPIILPAVEQLDESYYEGLLDQKKHQDFLRELSDMMIGIIQGTPQKMERYSATIEKDESVIIHQHVISDHDQFNEGDWFFFNIDSDRGLRAKLLTKAVDRDFLIFVNCHGKKVHKSTFEDFKLQLAAKNCLPIRRQHLFKQALYEALKALEIHHRKNLKSRQKELDDIETARLSAAQKAQEEARLITERQEAERLTREQHIKRRTEIKPEILERYSKQLKELHVGAWLGFHDEQGNIVNRKLSVKLAVSDRYIFTDRLGQPIGEKTLDELLDLMINQRLDIIRRGENFDNRLEEIVKGLRKPKNGESR